MFCLGWSTRACICFLLLLLTCALSSLCLNFHPCACCATAVMQSNPSFLFNNFELMMVKLQHAASIDILLQEVWRSVMVLLRQVYLNEVQTPLHGDQTKLLRFILALRSSFKAFFAGGGEGLADSIMVGGGGCVR